MYVANYNNESRYWHLASRADDHNFVYPYAISTGVTSNVYPPCSNVSNSTLT